VPNWEKVGEWLETKDEAGYGLPIQQPQNCAARGTMAQLGGVWRRLHGAVESERGSVTRSSFTSQKALRKSGDDLKYGVLRVTVPRYIICFQV
jgi:hypothetical protein